ncbi:MAG TPA: hypothetical protein VK501_17730 [Baekduia sp.]|uniref:hypothetical protein n=1 Tax=Baekduia sp. TaxID=2600305 RepID=UPI002C9AA3FB|nr:hypothetical protein [Baekduia sp.]HMJ35749.1 hypothetical protein [Baekduia sp.]
MRRPVAALPLALLLLPAAAHGAEVQTDRACYLETDKTTVTISGNGYTPARPYTVSLDNTPLSGGAGTMDAAGVMRGAFTPPALTKDQNERMFTVGVQSDALVAQTTFTVTRFKASFSPSKGDPAKLKVRFRVNGFGLGGPDPDVYVHYVAPGGKLRQTVRLGRAQGQCGSIARTAQRRLFPFPSPKHGKWALQFDTSKTYKRGVRGSPFLFYTVGVNVHRASAS